MLVLGLWLAAMVYHEMITPLQLKLVESREIIERQEKLASLGVLAAGVAHEIRNPLTAIKARLFTQQKSLAPGTVEYEDSLVIGAEINRLEEIVRSFLLFARPPEPHFATVPVAEPLRAVCDLLSPQLRNQYINLILESIPDVLLQADAGQLKQVLINLIQNAADSIPGRGTVTVRVRTDHTRLHGETTAVVIIEVQDTGKGISAEVQKRLFDPFFSTKATGTGLGLSIAGRIVEKHGGALEFQTGMNRGTTFGIVLPRMT